MFLLLIQVVVPLALLATLTVRTHSRLLKMTQALSVFGYLSAVHLAGLWLDFPWWTPWVLWALYALCLAAGSRPKAAEAPAAPSSWLFTTMWSVSALLFGWLALTAALARIPPPGPAVNVASPLQTARYLVANGGNRSLTNAHLETLNGGTPRKAAYRGQSYGIDIVGLTPFGRTSTAWQPRQPERYAIFGTPILAPCNGKVVARLDGRRDMPVPITDEQVMAGNHVVLRCGDVHLLLAHMRRGSVEVREGQLVRVGERLGEVGNSGNSDAPHLHIHAQRPGQPGALFAADPIPLRINGRYLVRGDRL